MNIILDAQNQSQTKSFDQNIFTNVKGIAIKLTELKKNGITLKDCLSGHDLNILIDAEFDRLDFFIESQRTQNLLKDIELSRLIVTVQARRSDADAQLMYFQENNISVILVAGNRAYISGNGQKTSISQLMVAYFRNYSCIQYLGVGGKLLANIEKHLGHTLSEDKIIELFGEYELDNSSLWAFVYQDSTSRALTEYVNRRISLDTNHEVNVARYSIDISQIQTITRSDRHFYLYLDFKTHDQFASYISVIQ